MKKVVLILMISLFTISFSNPSLQGDKIQQVFRGTISNSLVTIFKRPSTETPFFVQAKNNMSERKFYVIRWKSDVFSYLMVEKKGNETYYYPLGWSDLASITVNDLQQRIKDILGGKIPRVPKENL